MGKYFLFFLLPFLPPFSLSLLLSSVFFLPSSSLLLLLLLSPPPPPSSFSSSYLLTSFAFIPYPLPAPPSIDLFPYFFLYLKDTPLPLASSNGCSFHSYHQICTSLFYVSTLVLYHKQDIEHHIMRKLFQFLSTF